MQSTSPKNPKLAAVRVLHPADNNVAIGPWLNIDEAAEYLKLTRRALYLAALKGQVRVHRLGRRLRFHRTDLDHALIASGPASRSP